MATNKLALAAALALAACTSNKQITLSIDTTAGVPCDIDHIKVIAKGAQTSSVTRGISAGGLPLTVTLSDETDDNGFELDVVGMKGTTPVLEKKGRLAFTGDVAYVVLEPQCAAGPNPACGLPALVPDTATPPAAQPRYGCGAVARYAQQAGDAVFLDTCALPENKTDINMTGAVSFGPNPVPLELTDLAPLLASSKFRFYGQPIRHVWVDRHGYLSVGETSPDPANSHPPDAFDVQGHAPPPQSMMVFWDNLTASASGVCYSLEGEPGIRTLRVTWANTCLVNTCSATESLNFTAVLYEHTQRIDFTYGRMASANESGRTGGTATVGIVNQAPGCPVAQCSPLTGLCQDGKTPCSYSQVFSKTVQKDGVQNIGFEPVFDN
ncbi:MAG TPA: hypothetical protein VFP84_30495 [Kofleriaceae bacterium]|nr:hypothetical protein [Kofleriaceae bacterium]